MKFHNDEQMSRSTDAQAADHLGAEETRDESRLAYEPPRITRKTAVRRVTLFSGSSSGAFTGGG